MNRETWLNQLALKLAPRYAELGYPLPSFRVSVGFTSGGMNSRANGECWDKSTSADAHYSIFISPGEGQNVAIAAILNHELIHAAVGFDQGHKGNFAKVMQATGMGRPFTSSVPAPGFVEWVKPYLDELGEIPHCPLKWRQEGTKERRVKRDAGGVVDVPKEDGEEQEGESPSVGGESTRPPKQTARLLKVECGQCGYVVRVTRKWLDVGPPGCPEHGAMDLPDGE